MMQIKERFRARAREKSFKKENFELKLSENYFHSNYRTHSIRMRIQLRLSLIMRIAH